MPSAPATSAEIEEEWWLLESTTTRVQFINVNLVGATNRSSHFKCIATSAFVSSGRQRLTRPAWRSAPSLPNENVVRRQLMMLSAYAVLAGSLISTDAQARDGGGDVGRFGRAHIVAHG
jgi:hypothetical protein